MASILRRLEGHGLLGRVVIDDTLRALLDGIAVDGEPEAEGSVETGTCAVGALGASPLGFLDLQLAAPLEHVPFRLVLEGGTPATGFRFFLSLSEASPANAAFSFAAGAAGALTAAEPKSDGQEEWLESTGNEAKLKGVALSLLVRGREGGAAEALLTPTQGVPEGIVNLTLEPPTVLVGDSGFGFDLAQGLALDASAGAAAPGKAEIMGEQVELPADTDSWQGLVIRRARLFMPKGAPLLGGQVVETFLAIGSDPPGIDFAVATEIPAAGDRPRIEVRIECRDPTARGLSGFLPTLVEGAMDLPLGGQHGLENGNSITVLAGTPVTARVSLAREPTATPPRTRVKLGLEAQGERGLLTIEAKGGGVGERGAVAAAALVTALAADRPGPLSGDPAADGAHYLNLLLTAGVGLSAFLEQDGRVVVHGVELEGEGPGIELGERLKLTLDYSVDALVKTFKVGTLQVGMDEHQPMRVRVRKVELTIDRTKSGLEQFKLGFDRASMELEDPGAWKVQGPANLFEVLGTRSGRGSMWIEVDLRFKLDLGPVKVEGATVRGTLDDHGNLSAELSGLAASLTVPGLVAGRGKVEIGEQRFAAALAVKLLPLEVSAAAGLEVDQEMVKLELGVDLPGAIPLANSGLGIYGLAGAFVANGVPDVSQPPGDDLITRQLKWDHGKAGAFTPAGGASTIGVEAVIGTVPDLGFAFSAKAGLFVTVPDVAIRVGLAGKVMSPRFMVTDRPGDERDPVKIGFRGVIVVDPADGVTIGLLGEYEVPFLLDARLPIGARFPKRGNDWFVYIGADGYPDQERGMGPIQVRLLPDLVGTEGGAFLMMRGEGIKEFGRRAPKTNVDRGFVLAFGFGFELVLGVKGLVWAEVHAGADFLLATNPMLFAGYGEVGGSLNLGPISIGVDARLRFLLGELQPPYLFAQVCGHVDLFFTELEGCVEISVGEKPPETVPLPNEHPLDRREGTGPAPFSNAALIDHTYNRVAELATDPAAAPVVWPDTLVQLTFATPPHLAAGLGGTQFPSVAGTYGSRARAVGSEMLSYDWTLNKLELWELGGDTEKLVPGTLSAAWQAGRGGASGEVAEPAELVLLSPEGELWLQRTAGDGSGLPHDPIGERARSCQLARSATPGWTAGWEAERIASGHRLVPMALSPDPTVSELRGTARTRCSGLAGEGLLTPASAKLLPFPLEHVPAHVVSFAEPVSLPSGEEIWPGYLELDDVGVPIFGETEPEEEGEEREERLAIDRELRQLWTIELEDEIEEGLLWLVLGNDEHATVGDEFGQWGRGEAVELPEGRTAWSYEAESGRPVQRIEVVWDAFSHPGFIALRGKTAAALEAARAETAAHAARAKRLADAKSDGPQGSNGALGEAHPTVLQPDRLYRIDVGLEWKGQLKVRQEDGSDKVTPGGGTEYLAGGALAPCSRSYWFRTAKLQEPAGGTQPLMLALPGFGADGRIEFLHRKRDIFHPAMLERHFAGYEPGQSEQFRFCDDPLLAHFDANHVGALADAYGFDLKLGLTRVDAPGPAGTLQLLIAALTAIQAPWLLDPVARRWAELALHGPCPVPAPGATLAALAPLAPEAWYELFVLAASREDEIKDGRLPAVTFRTSRWRDPRGMIAALGFPPVAGRAGGDLELATDPALLTKVEEGSDAAFEAGLAQLGIAAMPAPGAPRTSLLWRPAGDSWLLVGALLESPEPILRERRLTWGRLGFGFAGQEDAGLAFELRRRDRVGARLLLCAPRPIQLGPAGPALYLHLNGTREGEVGGVLGVPPYPAFAGEPA